MPAMPCRCSRDKYAYLSNFRWYTGVLIDLSRVEVRPVPTPFLKHTVLVACRDRTAPFFSGLEKYYLYVVTITFVWCLPWSLTGCWRLLFVGAVLFGFAGFV